MIEDYLAFLTTGSRITQTKTRTQPTVGERMLYFTAPYSLICV